MAVSNAASAFAKSLGYATVKPKPIKPLQNPWNLNIPGLPDNGGHIIGQPIPASVAPPAPAAPPPPPPPDFNALTLTDPQYTTGKQNLEAQNQITLEGLFNHFRQAGQASQDNANAHGALFSGAAVNAQRSLGQGYADQQRQQALNYGSAGSSLYFDVFNRLKQQLAGGGA